MGSASVRLGNSSGSREVVFLLEFHEALRRNIKDLRERNRDLCTNALPARDNPTYYRVVNVEHSGQHLFIKAAIGKKRFDELAGGAKVRLHPHGIP